MREELEEQRERYVRGVLLRVLWTSLVGLVLVGLLSWLTVALGWRTYALPRAMGLAAGIALAFAASGSGRGRETTALVLGAVTLPLLAAHLASFAAAGGPALDAYGAALVPFLVHASGAAVAGASISAIWRRPPSPAPAPPEEEPDRAAIVAAAAAPGARPRLAGPPASGDDREARNARRTSP